MSCTNAVNNEDQEFLTIFVETLTGTTFEVKVSPQDNVKSIKSKIQKVEGIPVSHQHLIYNCRELEDSSCVSEPPVALQDQATVKLVLSMRGGPISLVHQAVPLNRAILKNLVKFKREDLLEELPAGCKMAVLVLRIGDQLNLLHVVEDSEDTSDVPANRRLNHYRDLLESVRPRRKFDFDVNLEENSVTLDKVCDLKERLGKLSLQRKSQKAGCKVEEFNSAVHGNVSHPSQSGSSLKLPSMSQVRGEMFKSRSEFSQVPILPDIIRQPFKNTTRDLEFLSLDEGATSSEICNTIRPKTSPAVMTESQYCSAFREDGYHQHSVQIAQPYFRSCVSACTSKLHHEWGGGKSLLQSLNILPPISSVPDVLSNRRMLSNSEPRHAQASADPLLEELNIHRNMDSERKVGNNERRSSQSVVPSVEKINLHHRNLDIERKTVNNEHRNSQTLVPFFRGNLDERRKILNHIQTNVVPSIKKQNSFQKDLSRMVKFKNSRRDSQPSTSRNESGFLSKSANYSEKAHFELTNSHHSAPNSYELFPRGSSSSTDLPFGELISKARSSLVEPGLENEKITIEKKSRLRCSECKKRLSFTNTFECRCGFAFCSYHRYSETHHCTYDFKKESRKMLEQANPSVLAPKLPKI